VQFAVAESLSVYERVLDETFRALRECGKQRDECVVYWTGPVGEHLVDGIVRPPHSASPQHYHVDDLWITRYFLELRSSGRTTRAQVHTHPGRHVRHSTTDDDFPLVRAPGFISIVLPHFASRAVGLSDAFVAMVDPDGSWAELPPEASFQWL
jgi:hypothetical protein